MKTQNKFAKLTAGIAVPAVLAFALPLSILAQPADDFDPPGEVAEIVQRQVQQIVAQATRQAEQAQDDAQRQVGEVRDQVLLRRAPGATADRLQSIVRRGPGGGGKALVIRSSDLDSKDQTNLEEDLAVMSHLLEKTVDENSGRQSHPRKAMGIDLFFNPASTPFRSMFIEGYGALFLVNVGFPLLPAPSKETSAKEGPATGSAWDEARRELYGGHFERNWVAGPVEEYNEDKVTRLKDDLLEALKNAAHIRNLKGEDTVTVSVFGGPSGPSARGKTSITRSSPKRSPAGPREEREEVIVKAGDEGAGSPRGTVMTISVKKADAEAFANGKMTADEFRNKARITTYAGGVAGEGMMPFGFGGGFSGSFSETR
jgi:hypothetical protein